MEKVGAAMSYLKDVSGSNKEISKIKEIHNKKLNVAFRDLLALSRSLK